MVKKGHQNGQDQHLKQAPATIYPPQTPYNRKQNQLHGGRHSPVRLSGIPTQPAKRCHPSLTLSGKHDKAVRPQLGRRLRDPH